MDETREKLGNDSPFKGRKARTYKHYVFSPDPRDAVSLIRPKEDLARGSLADARDGRTGAEAGGVRPYPLPPGPPHRDPAVLAQVRHELGAEHGLAAADPDGAHLLHDEPGLRCPAAQVLPHVVHEHQVVVAGARASLYLRVHSASPFPATAQCRGASSSTTSPLEHEARGARMPENVACRSCAWARRRRTGEARRGAGQRASRENPRGLAAAWLPQCSTL